MSTRLGASLLHGAVCGYSSLRDHRYKIGKCSDAKCRYGCGYTEDLQHVLFNCPRCSTVREKIRKVCLQKKLEFNAGNLMCHPDLHRLTEKMFLLFTGQVTFGLSGRFPFEKNSKSQNLTLSNMAQNHIKIMFRV